MAAGTRATASTYWARTKNDTARNSFFTPRMERAAPGEERHAVTGPKTYGVSACLAAGRHVRREVWHKSGSPAPQAVQRHPARMRHTYASTEGQARQPGASPPPTPPR